jgi:hypothetical protein
VEHQVSKLVVTNVLITEQAQLFQTVSVQVLLITLKHVLMLHVKIHLDGVTVTGVAVQLQNVEQVVHKLVAISVLMKEQAQQ